MKLLVLAGGFGTRLQSVVSEVPKALAPVGHLPFLYLQIENWISQGLRSFIFLLHHKADLIIDFLEYEKTNLLKDCEVGWIVEPKPMDTGGAVAYAIRHLMLDGDFLLTNADTWLGTGIQAVANCTAPAIAVVKLSDTSRYGQIRFDNQFKVIAFTEKNKTHENGWINAGLCHLNADLFRHWYGKSFSLERVLFTQLVGKGLLTAVALKTDFLDIGIPSDYSRFCIWIQNKRKGRI